MTVNTQFVFGPNIYKKQHGAALCGENAVHFLCTPKNEGKRVHVPPDGKTCGHTVTGLNTNGSPVVLG